MKTASMLALFLAVPIAGFAHGQMNAAPEMANQGIKMTTPHDATAMTHKTTALVKAVDPVKGRVTLAHGAIKSLNWPPMTMAFVVKDKRLLDRLEVGKQVQVELKKEGADYVVVAVK